MNRLFWTTLNIKRTEVGKTTNTHYTFAIAIATLRPTINDKSYENYCTYVCGARTRNAYVLVCLCVHTGTNVMISAATATDEIRCDRLLTRFRLHGNRPVKHYPSCE